MSAAPSEKLKIALAHDYLIKTGGAERVLEVLHNMYPEAPIYTLVYSESRTGGRYESWDIRTSWLQKAPGVLKLIDYYRALMPQAVESFDLSGYDVVISDSSSFIKGVITQANTMHVTYMHSPTRFLWFNIESHIERARFLSVLKVFIPSVLHRIRIWDTIAATRPDRIIANSRATRDRIKKFYHRDSSIVYPPVDLDRFDYKKRKPEDHYLIISRLEPHKDIDIAIQACNEFNIPLKIIGIGGDESRLRALSGPTIEFLGQCSDNEVNQHLYRAKALLAPQIEDFGITMVESLAAGCPVIARDEGGAREIVQDGVNGIVIKELNKQNLSHAMRQFHPEQFLAERCASSVKQFSTEQFRSNIQLVISACAKERTNNGAL